MKLRYSPTSPYARKVLIVAKETGLDGKIQIVETKLGPDSDIHQQNPLGKVPTMVLDDGTAIFDSPVICEYIDSQSTGAKMFPPAGPARWKALVMQGLADGLMDAGKARRRVGRAGHHRPGHRRLRARLSRPAVRRRPVAQDAPKAGRLVRDLLQAPVDGLHGSAHLRWLCPRG